MEPITSRKSDKSSAVIWNAPLHTSYSRNCPAIMAPAHTHLDIKSCDGKYRRIWCTYMYVNVYWYVYVMYMSKYMCMYIQKLPRYNVSCPSHIGMGTFVLYTPRQNSFVLIIHICVHRFVDDTCACMSIWTHVWQKYYICRHMCVHHVCRCLYRQNYIRIRIGSNICIYVRVHPYMYVYISI